MKKITQFLGIMFIYLCIASTIYSQAVPELMYFRFHNNGAGTVHNYASSYVGLLDPPFTGSLGVTSGGQFDSCLVGNGPPAVANLSGVNTGWNTVLPANWTISFWIGNGMVDGNPSYLCGDVGASTFRIYYGGAAGLNNILCRGGSGDVLITGVQPGPTVVTIVYNGTNTVVYKNGASPQTYNVTFATTTGSGFRVGSYNTTVVSHMVGKMDEFRMYNRALSAAEVLATWNVELGTAPPSICSFACTLQTSGTTNLLQAVSTVNNLVGWVSGAAATVRRTVNGGTTWTNGNPNPGVITGDIYSMYATDSSNCLVTTSPAATFIYRTTNGGTNWTQVFTQAGGFIDGIVMTSPQLGYAVGDPVGARWSLWRTSNGGASWDSTGLYVPQIAGEAGWNNSMKVIGSNIWFGTSNTRVYHSSNAGLTWSFGASSAGNLNSYSLHFNSVTEGLVGGVFLDKTTNGGSTYTPLTAPGTGNITGLSGGSATYYWYTRGTNIYTTTNSGTTWTTAYTGTTALWGVDMQTVNGCPRGWAVGATGTIVKIGNDTLVGISNNNNQVPETYSLKQNYPNPFNPSTKISFSIPKGDNVKLVVYDILGKQIATLVNGFKQAGTYNVYFNAANVASGVYFYKIETGSFTDVKKMLLVK